MDFNRQIAPWVLDKLIDGGWFPVFPKLVHEHIGGRRAKPHMRCLVYFSLNDREEMGSAFVDMKMETFESLPSAAVPNSAPKRQLALAVGD